MRDVFNGNVWARLKVIAHITFEDEHFVLRLNMCVMSLR